MKKLIIYFSLLISCLLSNACIDDPGNYDYVNTNNILPVEIEGLCSDTSILKGETLRLSPIIINNDSSRYTYSWYIMDYNAQGFLPRQWDLSTKKNLEWTVNLDPATYRLNFRVYDKQQDLFVRHEIIINITAAPMTSGWYILKDNGQNTDLDYISLSNERYDNVLTMYGENIPGTAVLMAYQNGRYYHNITYDDGSVTTKSNLSVYHILTSNDIRTYDAKDYTLYKTFKDEFYTAPETCRPQNVLFGSSACTFLINNGKIHIINGMYGNIGKFGAPFPGTYDLANDLIMYGSGNFMVFDNNTHSFYQASQTGSNLLPIEEAATTTDTLSLQNMDYELQCSSSMERSYTSTIILKSIKGNHRLLLQETSVYDPENYSYIVQWLGITPIQSESKLASTRLIAQAKATSFFYFVLDDKIYSYINSTETSLEQRERERLSFPGETITYMTYISGLKQADGTVTEALAVLTSQGGNWKLRVYALLGESTPDLNTTPILEYEGTGNGRFLLYRP